MGCSPSVPSVPSNDKAKLHTPISPEGGRGVLWANSQDGWYHALGCERSCGTFLNDIPSSATDFRVVKPLERRFIELDPTEDQDGTIIFGLTREALKVREGWEFSVSYVQLVIDGVPSASSNIGDVLAWVEAPGEAPVLGSDVDTLLSVTRVMSVTSQPSSSDDCVMLAVDLPMGRYTKGTPSIVRAALHPDKAVQVRLIASVFTAPKTTPEYFPSHFVCPSQRVFRAQVGQESVDVPLRLPTFGLLQAIVVALPFHTVHVHDVALLLDGHEMVCVPGTVARTVFTTRFFSASPRPGWTYLCVPLSVDFVNTVQRNYCLRLCGELDLGSPVVRRGSLAVSVRFKRNEDGYCTGGGEVLVQACLLH